MALFLCNRPVFYVKQRFLHLFHPKLVNKKEGYHEIENKYSPLVCQSVRLSFSYPYSCRKV